MSERDGSNTHEVIGEIFRAMNVPIRDRAKAGLKRWADAFPYVNGGLLSGNLDAEDWKQDGVVDVSAGPSQADG